MEFRDVGIYFNKEGDIFIVPSRYCKEFGMVGSAPWFITHITDEDAVYENIKIAYEATAEGIKARPNPTPIEVITGIKDWERATRKLGLLDFQWRKDADGFELVLNKRNRGGFAGYKTIPLGKTIDDATFKPVILEKLKNELARHIKLMEKKKAKGTGGV